MAAPLNWLRDAIARRAAIVEAGGPRVSVATGVDGVTVFAEAQAVFRSWEDLDHFTSNPLVPAVDVVAQAQKRRLTSGIKPPINKTSRPVGPPDSKGESK